jgi:hypothetical protein
MRICQVILPRFLKNEEESIGLFFYSIENARAFSEHKKKRAVNPH